MSDTQDLGSVKGQGASIMLPARGNPFGSETGVEASPEMVYAVGAEAAPAAVEATPEPLPEMGAGLAEVSAPAMQEAPALPEPHDLSPEDLAAMFPSTPSGQDISAESMTPLTTADLKSATAMGADADLVDHEVPLMEAAGMGMAMAAEAAMPMAGGLEQPAPAMVEMPPATPMAPPAAPAGAQPGVRLPSDFQLAESVGVGLDQYKRDADVAANAQLVSMFVPDGQLLNMWLEIDAVEKEIVSIPGISRKLAEQLLERLSVARNKLMADRNFYEEAGKQLALVKYRLNRNKRSSRDQQPRVILAYLLFSIALLAIGFVSTTTIATIAGPRIAIEGFDFKIVWQAIMWGGIGGVTGALYGLWKHVAAEEDYDPQFALWYYTNPLMGVVLGAFVYILMQLTLPAVFGGNSENVQPSRYLVFALAWAVGFQQNLAFTLVNSVLKSFMKVAPEESKGNK